MKTILAEIQGLELRIGEPIEKVALDYKEYKKLHPNTKKTPSDPMFQSQRKAPTQPARTAPKAPAQTEKTLGTLKF